jgi:hypothetical protein
LRTRSENDYASYWKTSKELGISDAIAGTILSAINQALVEPYIDRAIPIETQNAIKEGEVVDPIELQDNRLCQTG